MTQLLSASVGLSACGTLRKGPFRPSWQPFRSPTQRSNVSTVSSAVPDGNEASTASGVDRRDLLFGLAAATVLTSAPSSFADEEPAELKTFLGMATPPTSYGGYGGNDPNATPKYAFEYPSGWKTDVINKVQKGTQGIDGRVFNPRNKFGEQVFVITLGRAGEDNADFQLRDIDATFSSFVGADYDLQDALSSSTNKTSTKREEGGQIYYDVDIFSPEVTYLSTVTVRLGKIYAMFVKLPSKTFNNNESKYRGIVKSFRLLDA